MCFGLQTKRKGVLKAQMPERNWEGNESGEDAQEEKKNGKLGGTKGSKCQGGLLSIKRGKGY